MMYLQTGHPGTIALDISYYQGYVDYEKVKSTGVSTVIIRAGYGKTIDKRFHTNIQGAINAGLTICVYWFIYAKTIYISTLNAEKCVQVLAPYKDVITAVWADWEYDSDKNAGAISTANRSNIVKNFLEHMEIEGYEVGIYANPDYIQSKFDRTLIATYPLWLARYASTMGNQATKGKGGYPYLWQYSSKASGKQYGASSQYVDINRCFFIKSNIKTIKECKCIFPEPKRTLYYEEGKYIMRGDDVKWAQEHMVEIGLSVEVDGYWGPKSDEACEVLQDMLHLKKDKKLGPATREAIKHKLGEL